MKRLVLLVFLLLTLGKLPLLAQSQLDTVQKIVDGRKNLKEQQLKPYLVMISIDGFRYDYPEKHGATYLQQLAADGVRAKYMVPSFPSLTFPNHYTLVTGLYPAHHGLVSNYFYDRQKRDRYSMRLPAKVGDASFYGGVPLWVLAEQQGMLAASFYWVGSEAPIRGVLPTYYYAYNERISMADRIAAVKNWLSLPDSTRPHFISFYFPEVDHAGHDFGPDAPETRAAVRLVDSSIYQLSEVARSTGLDVNFIVTSDHGMTTINQDEPVGIPQVDTSKYVLVSEGQLVQIYAKPGVDIAPLYFDLKNKAKHYIVYKRDEVPERLHYSKKDDCFGRIGDLVLIPEWPYAFSSSNRRLKPGAHGYDPYLVPDMRTIFMAWGPDFHSAKTIGALENVDVFPVAAKLLGLNYRHQIDGNKKTARKALKE